MLEQGILMSGQKVVDMDVPENGISEVLRLFIRSRSGHEDEVGVGVCFKLLLVCTEAVL